jgi:hypothetical protein
MSDRATQVKKTTLAPVAGTILQDRLLTERGAGRFFHVSCMAW